MCDVKESQWGQMEYLSYPVGQGGQESENMTQRHTDISVGQEMPNRIRAKELNEMQLWASEKNNKIIYITLILMRTSSS